MAWCFNNKKCQAKDACRKRCKSFFPGQKTLRKGCESLCKTGFTDFGKEEYLCSGKYVDEAAVMLEFGYDPCLTSGPTIPDILDPTDTAGQAERNYERLEPVYIGLGLLIVIALGVLFFKK
ncbi:hypothetical protein [Flavilitoribacter nigricans]|uniref:Uncharacterized protein n=1 Tax=Flavilitoribacter nigricans (strain ATCC 23147 / DSM 23189 / NBRC 102662 / NCIMB 1420 / SS-2) TaxID=1122177 RepID=A0A2D0NCE6_FLAN2|nr:hypothetical protein [Flavilitoribacter nigricans]PHN06165.1 hypothetical protein CRP01_11310 [Flavilitoribacter nigricans DSM 23189 = NBRC 102662]